MACNCGSSDFQNQPETSPEVMAFFNSDCSYTLEILREWQTKLQNAVINQQLDLLHLTGPQMNSYLGYVQSAINFPKNLCFYEIKLAEISQVITNIDAL